MPLPRAQPITPQPTAQPASLPFAGTTPALSLQGFVHLRRYAINPAVVDTSSLGDVLIPTGFNHVAIVWSARDTSVNNFGSFGRMQMAISGGPIITAASYAWSEVQAGAVAALGKNGVNGDTAMSCLVTAGGGQAGGVFNSGTIWLSFVSSINLVLATWSIAHVSPGDLITHNGAGGDVLNGGPLTKLRFTAGAGSFAVGTTFDLFGSA